MNVNICSLLHVTPKCAYSAVCTITCKRGSAKQGYDACFPMEKYDFPVPANMKPLTGQSENLHD
jgi:hypothetical protein